MLYFFINGLLVSSVLLVCKVQWVNLYCFIKRSEKGIYKSEFYGVREVRFLRRFKDRQKGTAKKIWDTHLKIGHLRQQFEKFYFYHFIRILCAVCFFFELISILISFFYNSFSQSMHLCQNDNECRIQLSQSSLLINTDALRMRSLIFVLCLTEAGLLFITFFNLDQNSSIGFKNGEYGGKKRSWYPRCSTESRTRLALWMDALSSTKYL